jgi:hypothetical protein
MRTLPRHLIAAMGGVAALAVAAPAAVAHGSGATHEMPGAGGMMGPDMMGQIGSDVMDLMGRWMSGPGSEDHPDIGEGPPMGPAMRKIPGMPGQDMGSKTVGPRMPGMPRMPRLPGAGGAPGMMMAPGFHVQMAPGWSG